ncbi:unnamed protein product [Protopolystoma xenopodis]|uniref:Uncharacterized protein n=1 Tax=Protopolystoma xenopodis TaxID=117903 RepID=A0A3S5BSR7_9PLAT|nr:unnamed protein product [Protopolystoma xenopodis]
MGCTASLKTRSRGRGQVGGLLLCPSSPALFGFILCSFVPPHPIRSLLSSLVGFWVFCSLFSIAPSYPLAGQSLGPDLETPPAIVTPV